MQKYKLLALLGALVISFASAQPADPPTPVTGDESEFLPDSTYEFAAEAARMEEPEGWPAGRRRGDPNHASGASVNFDESMSFSCSEETDSAGTSSGARFRTTEKCDSEGISLQRCDAMSEFGRGCQDGDWGPAVYIGNDSSAILGVADLSASCTDRSCEVVLQEEVTISRDAENASQAGSEKFQQIKSDAEINGGGFITDGVVKVGGSVEFNEAYQTTGVSFAKDHQKTQKGALSGRVVSGSGMDMGKLHYEPQVCKSTCISKTERHYRGESSCETSVPTNRYFCETTYGEGVCLKEKKSEYKTCEGSRSLETLVCNYFWRDANTKPSRSCGAYSCSDTSDLDCNEKLNADGWRSGLTYNRQRDAKGHLLRYSREFNRYSDWDDQCLVDQDTPLEEQQDPPEMLPPSEIGESCRLVSQECVDEDPIAGESSDRCITRESIYECDSDGYFNSCEDSGLTDSGVCSDKESSCRKVLELDAKQCHYEKPPKTANYGCPSGFQHNPATNSCTAQSSCPIGYERESDNVTCTLPGTGGRAGDILTELQNCEFSPRHNQDGEAMLFEAFARAPNENGTGGTSVIPLDVPASPSDESFSVDFNLSHEESHCSFDDPYRVNFSFYIEDIRTISDFRLVGGTWNDSIRISVNGTQVYRSGTNCQSGNSGESDIDETLLQHIKTGYNTIVIELISSPPTVSASINFSFIQACSVSAICSNGQVPNSGTQCKRNGELLNETAKRNPGGITPQSEGSQCELTTNTSSGGGVFSYDCGYENFFKTDCTDKEIQQMKFESRENEIKDDSDELVSYEEIYTFNERLVSYGCPTPEEERRCVVEPGECVEGGSKTISGVEIFRNCFENQEEYKCEPLLGESACATAPLPADCSLSGTICLVAGEEEGDDCLVIKESYICTETGVTQECNATPPSGASCTPSVSGCSSEDENGNCLAEMELTSCYTGEPELCMSPEKNCTYVSSECIEEENGICTEVRQDYQCDKVEYTCQESESICDTEPEELNLDGVAKVAAEFSKADALASEIGSETGDLNDIRVFSGEASRCSNTDLAGAGAGADCCGSNADIGGFIDQCNEEERELAAAKRADRVTQFGSYCATKINLGFTSICIKKRKTFCVFDSLLAKLVQEQGREQLNVMARSVSGSTQTDTTSVNYSSGNPGWKEIATVQGEPLYAWEWDEECKGAKSDLYSQTGIVCPQPSEAQPELWLSYCPKQAGCAPERQAPPYRSFSSTGWEYHLVGQKGSAHAAIAPNIEAIARCDSSDSAPLSFSSCEVTSTSWPRGQSGQAKSSMDISWQLFRPKEVGDNWAASVRTFGRFSFQPYQVDPGDESSFPDFVPLRVAVDDSNFQVYEVPTQTGPEGYELPTSPASTLFGECDLALNWCDMKVTTLSSVRNRPFCSNSKQKNCRKHELDCEGFTLEEFAVLDFGRMDLSDFTDTIETDIEDTEKFQNSMAIGVGGIQEDFEQGNEVPIEDYGQAVMRVSPTDGRPSWKTTASFAATYPGPEGDIPVSSIAIDWGDGSSDVLTVTSGGGQKTKEHTYTKGAGYREFVITATFMLQNGDSQSTQATVLSWETRPPKNTTGYGGGQGNYGTRRLDRSGDGLSTDLPAPPNFNDE